MTNLLIKFLAVLLLLQFAIALNNSGCQDYQYVSSNEPLVNPLAAGFDSSGETLYSCRANHEKQLVPGKYTPSKKTCHVPYGNREHSKQDGVEVLTNPNDSNFQWVESSSVPPNAVAGGRTDQNVNNYVVRCNVGQSHGQDNILPGKYQESHGAYTGLGNREIKCKNFEFLTCVE